MTLDAVVILSHHLDENGELDFETIARMRLAVELHRGSKSNFIITSGWDHRSDSTEKIGEVVCRDLIRSFSINPNEILVDTEARDTVGDAFYLRKNILLPFKIRSITLITSDYHVARAYYIFKSFLAPLIQVASVAVPSDKSTNQNTLSHEINSRTAFSKTFSGIDLWDDLAVCRTLASRHPFYNGEMHKRITCK